MVHPMRSTVYQFATSRALAVTSLGQSAINPQTGEFSQILSLFLLSPYLISSSSPTCLNTHSWR